MTAAIKFEKSGDGRYDVESLNHASESYYIVQDEKSKKWTVNLSDGQEIGENLTFAEAKKVVLGHEQEGVLPEEETSNEPVATSDGTKEQWIVILEDGTQKTFKSAGMKQAKYRAYRIGKDAGSKVVELHHGPKVESVEPPAEAEMQVEVETEIAEEGSEAKQ